MKHWNQYTPKFKRRALDPVKENGKSLAEAAKVFEIKHNTLYNLHQIAMNKVDVGYHIPSITQ